MISSFLHHTDHTKVREPIKQLNIPQSLVKNTRTCKQMKTPCTSFVLTKTASMAPESSVVLCFVEIDRPFSSPATLSCAFRSPIINMKRVNNFHSNFKTDNQRATMYWQITYQIWRKRSFSNSMGERNNCCLLLLCQWSILTHEKSKIELATTGKFSIHENIRKLFQPKRQYMTCIHIYLFIEKNDLKLIPRF